MCTALYSWKKQKLQEFGKLKKKTWLASWAGFHFRSQLLQVNSVTLHILWCPDVIHCLTPSLSFAVSIREVFFMCALFLSCVLCSFHFFQLQFYICYVTICKGCVACPILHLIALTVFGERCDLIDNKILVILVWRVLQCCPDVSMTPGLVMVGWLL